MSKQIHVGKVAVGGGAPVSIQSMCNTHTEDTPATVAQILRLEQAGCEIVRVAVPDMAAALAGFAGDVTMSAIKRDCGVKDFGKIFPGHGGVMDRLDGILFATLACHLFFRVMG